ncbi:hypothetical protein [Alloprevotella tannerae]|uniref:Uncharacterized protein n=1 Tax=Alloprevotella tannerae TaxID=76122 RepID=A0A929S076_9BACT|nr:hypothetical protein [Alloprevotella tannerae]MBF0970894.1 hypothetical protein [Alloprevotella tannerae]
MRSKASLRCKVYFNRRPAYHHWIIGESHAYLRTPDCFVHRLAAANDGLAAANDGLVAANDGLVGANDGLATANEQTLNSNKR